MKTLWIIPFLLLTGCEKVMKTATGVSLMKKSTSVTQPNLAGPSIVIYWGQSNAVGFGQSSPTPLSPGVTWRGLDFPRGSGAEFGNDFVQHFGSQVIIAQCSVGGTSIYEWLGGGGLFDQCMGIVQNIKNDTPNAQVVAILAWQGEYDAKNPGVPWASLFNNVIDSFRLGLNDNNIPVIFCQIDTNQFFNQAPLYPYWTDIQNQQAMVSLPLTTMVKTSDITDIADSVHVGSAGLATIGDRMFQAYIGLLD